MSRGHEIPWTEQDVTEATRLWRDGLSARLIGKALNRTKNSIVGKVKRLGLTGRANPVAHMYGPPPPRPVRALPVALPVLFFPEPIEAPQQTVLTLTGRCLWPLWASDVRPSHEYCGDRRASGSYCTTHARRAYLPRRYRVEA